MRPSPSGRSLCLQATRNNGEIVYRRAADDENREIVEEALKQCLDGDFSSCREVAECEDSSPSSLPCFHARELVSSSSGTLGEREQHTDDELSDASDESMSSMSPRSPVSR